MPETLVTFELTIFSFFPLRYFCSIIFYSYKKVEGGGAKAPPQPLPLRGPWLVKLKKYTWRKKNLEVLQSKSISAFATAAEQDMDFTI